MECRIRGAWAHPEKYADNPLVRTTLPAQTRVRSIGMFTRLYNGHQVDRLLELAEKQGRYLTAEEMNWQLTQDEFRAMRETLGLTRRQLASIMGVSVHTLITWESNPETNTGARAPSPVACKLMFYMVQGFRPPDWPNPDERPAGYEKIMRDSDERLD